MVRRRPRWALLALVVALVLVGWINIRRSQSSVGWGRQLLLHEGQVEIVRVEDAVTLVVHALDGPARQYNGDFRVRLMGLERPTTDDLDARERASRGLERTTQFVNQCPKRVATLIFDRQRFDETETPLAYLFSDDVCLNAELLEARVVRLKTPSGLPSKWMRELIKIAGEPQPSRSPQRMSANTSPERTVLVDKVAN